MDESDEVIEAFRCPSCGEAVAAMPGAWARMETCAVCGERFVLPSETGGVELPPEDSGPVDPHDSTDAGVLDYDGGDIRSAAHDQAELDDARIKRIVATRRAVIRQRSYMVLASVLCLLVSLQLSWATTTALRFSPEPSVLAAAIYLIGTTALAVAAVWFAVRVVRLTQEIRQSALPPPTTEPDFATLSDGTQFADRLREIR